MSLTIELNASEEALLAAAAREQGLPLEELARRVLLGHLPTVNAARPEDPALALFRQWAVQDAQRTPDEVAAENELWERFQENINATRQELGMRPL